MATNSARGMRNNNPLNLRISGNAWLGKVAHNTDGSFEQFTTLEHGLRAAILNINTIVRRRKKQRLQTTIKDLISIWAPAADNNNEESYVSTIHTYTQLPGNTIIDPSNKNQICRIVWAMAIVECNERISFVRIENAYAMARPCIMCKQ